MCRIIRFNAYEKKISIWEEKRHYELPQHSNNHTFFTCNSHVIDKDNKNTILSIYSMFIINIYVQYNIVTYDVL